MNIDKYITELQERKWTSPEEVDEYFRTTLHAVADEARRECLEEVYAGARHYSFVFSKPLGFKGMCSPDVNRTLVPIEHIESLIYKQTQ